MGLDTTHDAWHGPYSAFSRWRNHLAVVAGYKVEPQTYDDGMTWDTAQMDWQAIERANPDCYAGEWNEPQADALVYLLAHSDCDGVLHPQQAHPLADRLEALLPLMDATDQWRDKTLWFIDGLKRAVALGEDIGFH